MTQTDSEFTVADDALHPPSDNFYENETFWYSFFVPERKIGGWIYTGVRQNAGVTHGGLWLWDDSGASPWDLPFFEQFSALKLPVFDGPVMRSPTGATIEVVEPGMVYELRYHDRKRLDLELTFRGTERPVPLRRGAPPYPAASHFDQVGRVTGHLVLDGERIDVDCHAMRDRSWGPRTERGYGRVGYTWLADAEITQLTFSTPTEVSDLIHSGYLRQGDAVTSVASGHRTVSRDPEQCWVEAMDVVTEDETGHQTLARGRVLSRMILPGATSVCINSLIAFEVDGRTVYGEDQDVWPMDAFRAARAQGRVSSR